MAQQGIRTTRGRGRLYDSILDTVGDTPVIRINNLAPEGVRLYVKAEFFNPAASVKDRLALNIIEAAERSGALKQQRVGKWKKKKWSPKGFSRRKEKRRQSENNDATARSTEK